MFVHDNHVACNSDEVPKFANATFHMFLRGFDDALLSAPSRERMDDVEQLTINIDGVRVQLRPGYGKAVDFYLKGPRYWLQAYKVFKNQFIDVDVVVVCGPCSSAILAYLAAKKLNKPIVAYYIGDPRKVVESSYKDERWVVRLLARMGSAWEWFVMKRIASSHAAVALGGEIYQEIRPYAKRIMKGATSLVSEDDICPPKNSIDSNPLKILTASRVSSEKGLDTAVDAINLLLKKGLDVQYRIAGDGPFRSKLEEKIQACELRQHVRLLGKIPYGELKREYRRADLFLLPSHSEGVPKVLFEAMAAGIPIVATDVGGVGDILGNGKRGWLCKPGDPQSLVMAMCDCLNDGRLRRTKLRYAHEYIQDHTREAQAERLVNFIRECFF